MVLRLLNTKKEYFQPYENDLECHVLVQLVHLHIAGCTNAIRCMIFFEKKRRASIKLINLS